MILLPGVIFRASYLHTAYGPAVVNNETQAKVDPDLDESTYATDDRYYFMPGDYFLIPYKEIKNLNVIYYREQELSDVQEA